VVFVVVVDVVLDFAVFDGAGVDFTDVVLDFAVLDGDFTDVVVDVPVLVVTGLDFSKRLNLSALFSRASLSP
jgi:hypothetical protein